MILSKIKKSKPTKIITYKLAYEAQGAQFKLKGCGFFLFVCLF